MDTTPDLSFYFAVHRHQRADLHRYVEAVASASEQDRPSRLRALARWSRGFTHELEEHHHVEDAFFFPDLRAKVPTAAGVLDRLEADHRRLDELLADWPRAAHDLHDRRVPFASARSAALELATSLRDLLLVHLDVEDQDVLPLFYRHYSAAEYDVLFQRAVKGGKKAGLGFVVPWSVDCLDGEEAAAFVAAAPLPLRLVHRLVRPGYDRMLAAAFGAEALLDA
ncbi:hypothetical protein BH10ACT1_BH10ACT1_03760 [soil metagenome]